MSHEAPGQIENREQRDQVEKDILTSMKKPSLLFLACLGFTVALATILLACWGYQIKTGLIVSGKNHPVGWYMYITSFVFWVGIAHSGTLISAILYLLRAGFRKSFNRSAEAMTVFSLMVAGMFPLIHLGRIWLFYWLMPYPNQRQIWVNFRSPLIWDVFAVGTYFTVSLIFFYVGMIPDLAIVRRCSDGFKKRIYSVLSLGWLGTPSQWRHYNQLYLLLASLATPLVLSVHSVVSWDFAMSIVPGWHTTIFAPYFVAGAIFSGTAMVILLVIPMRRMLSLEKYISVDDFENIAKILLFTSLIVTYSYIVEFCLAFYSGNIFEETVYKYRVLGDFKIMFWIMIFGNSILPLTLFIRKLRRNLPYLFVTSIFVIIGMWFERFVIIVTSLARDFDPYNWGIPNLSIIAIGIVLGSFGLFFMMFLLFVKLFPVLSITELKEKLE